MKRLFFVLSITASLLSSESGREKFRVTLTGKKRKEIIKNKEFSFMTDEEIQIAHEKEEKAVKRQKPMYNYSKKGKLVVFCFLCNEEFDKKSFSCIHTRKKQAFSRINPKLGKYIENRVWKTIPCSTCGKTFVCYQSKKNDHTCDLSTKLTKNKCYSNLRIVLLRHKKICANKQNN